MNHFDDIKNKFVLVNTTEGLVIYIGRCVFHKDLVSENDINKKRVLGGGEWEFSKDSGKLKLFGESHDFGWVNIDVIKPVLEEKKLYQRPGRVFQLNDKIKEIEFVEIYPYKNIIIK